MLTILFNLQYLILIVLNKFTIQEVTIMSKYAILVKSGSFDNMNTAALLASGAVANDHEVLMFLCTMQYGP